MWKSLGFSTISRKRPCPRSPGDADCQRKRKPLPPCARRLLRFPKRNKFLFAKPDSLAAVVAPEKTGKPRVPFFWRSGTALLGSCGVAFVRSLPIIQYYVSRKGKKSSCKHNHPSQTKSTAPKGGGWLYLRQLIMQGNRDCAFDLGTFCQFVENHKITNESKVLEE